METCNQILCKDSTTILRSEDLLKDMKYQKPEIKQEKKMTFMFDALKRDKPSKISCRQCSSCHGCR